jgi:hypothetical protein
MRYCNSVDHVSLFAFQNSKHAVATRASMEVLVSMETTASRVTVPPLAIMVNCVNTYH